MIGIGIDTGGTYTDAVVYDLEKRQILAAAKSLTTRQDLKIGIGSALRLLPQEELKKAGVIALSTTLATNACVEEKGGRGRLILIGVPEKTIRELGKQYGLDTDDVVLLPADIRASVEESTPPDWQDFEKRIPEITRDCDCISIVQVFSREHLGAYEEKAGELIRKHSEVPVYYGHDLFSDLNVLKRGSGALLNARLISVIFDFLAAVRRVLLELDLRLPIVIVRSDSSLMSEEFSCQRPVETILCGPAASILGAGELTHERHAVIVDMGGTTTDISVIRDGKPLRNRDGIRIGRWKTLVRGMYVDTFGLGGDTALHYTLEDGFSLENSRVIPLCVLAAGHPEVLDDLRRLNAERGEGHSDLPLYEFLVLQHDLPEDVSGYTKRELELVGRLQQGPLMRGDSERDLGVDFYNLRPDRLIRQGIVMRAGFTPTDAMHMKGDFGKFSAEASCLAADYLCRERRNLQEELTRAALADRVYDLVERRLYCNIVRILLKLEHPEFAKLKGDEIAKLIGTAYEDSRAAAAKRKAGGADGGAACFLLPFFHTDAALIGEGAPTHLFLGDVAELLGTRAVIPPHADVANAVGAIAGKIVASASALLEPEAQAESDEGYRVTCKNEIRHFDSFDEALEFAKQAAERTAETEARQYGAGGRLECIFSTERREFGAAASTCLLDQKITATVSGAAF